MYIKFKKLNLKQCFILYKGKHDNDTKESNYFNNISTASTSLVPATLLIKTITNNFYKMDKFS